MEEHLWRRIGRRLCRQWNTPTEIVPLLTRWGGVQRLSSLFSCIKRGSFALLCDPLRGHCEAGSLTGAVHLSNDNAGVLRPAQWGRKPHVEHKGKCWLDLSLQYGARSRNVGLTILFISEFEERGVRKITTGITGLWPPRVQIDVAFWSFDVGSSYHCEAEFAQRRIVHPLIGNVSWV